MTIRRPDSASANPVALIFLPRDATPRSVQTLDGLLSGSPSSAEVFLPGGRHAEGLLAGLPEPLRARVRSVDDAAGNLAWLVNVAARRTPGAELVLVAENVTFSQDWFERLRATAWSDQTVAAATTLAHDQGPRPDSTQHPAAALGQTRPRAAPTHPQTLSLGPHCVWIRRSALQLIGAFDEALTHPAAVLTDFAARAVAHGLSCILADDVWLVRDDDLVPCPQADQGILHARYPWLAGALQLQAAEPSPLGRVLTAVARSPGRALSVTVDARALGGRMDGTSRYIEGLTRALGQFGRAKVRAVVADKAPPGVGHRLTDYGVEVVTAEQVLGGLPRTDVVHRPQQVFTPEDLSFLHRVGDRLVISHMDLISFRNPTYHVSTEAWRRHRLTTRLALAQADQVAFFSRHARDEAIAEELIQAIRSPVVGVGIEPPSPNQLAQRPEAVPADRKLLLALGADYAHKNRPFAIELADELRRRHGWDGLLVLAGPHQPYGSSRSAETLLLRERPELATRVLDLGPVSEAEKRWLMSAAEAQIYASNYEGFGLTPLETAAVGRPCIYAACTSLREIIPPAAATIVPWDVTASAANAAPLLRPGKPRELHLSLLSQAVQDFTWERVVPQLMDTYEAAYTSPPREGAQLAREAFCQDAARRDLQERVSYGQLLIDGQGGLLTRAQQRGLMRVATRSWIRKPLLAPFGLLGADEHGCEGD